MPLILVMAGLLAPVAPVVEMHLPAITVSFAFAETKPPPPATTQDLIDTAATSAGISTTTARAIAWCESHYRQFEQDGTLRRGAVNSKDVGVMQVNEYYHQASAEKQGLDIHTTEGNIAYGIGLLKKEGTKPWSASAGCWRPLLKNPQLIPTTTPEK